VTWVLLALGSVYLFFNDAEFALKPRVWIVERLWGPVSPQFAND
jgi:hypothetical protein